MRNPTVLVVEDCPAQQLYAGQLLKQLKIQHISYAIDGELALELLQRQHQSQLIDVILIDLDMPQMNGVQLLRVIAQQQLCQNIIINSAKDNLLLNAVTTMAEADGLTVLGTLTKPVTKQALAWCFLRWRADICADPSKGAAASLSASVLREGMTNNQFYLHYQPIMCAKNHSVHAFEALARWRQLDGSEVAPDVFIAAAEALGLINELSLQLLEQALTELKRWQSAAYSSGKSAVQLSFNLSALSVSDQDYIQQIMLKVRQHGVAPELICWEITETHDFTELAAAIHGMATLRLNGFSVAIDDYGTGFANAQQLSRIPATRLKLDRSLVHHVSQWPQLRPELEKTVRMAHRLGVDLIAEGVENDLDCRVLTELGIELFQGYLFSKPVKAEDCNQQIQAGCRILI